MRIAICDDEDQERLNIEALVKRYAPELSIVLFSSADELLAAAKTTFFPLIFLDIEMDDTNGFDAAEELMSGSAKPLIVFVTKSTEYTIRGYDVAFHYLVKPLNEAKFHEVLKRALRLIIPQYFTFSSNGELYRIPVQEILYFESRIYAFRSYTAADLQSSLEPERGRTPIIISQFSSYSCQFLNQSASCNSHNKRRYRNAGPSTHQNQ